jgi:hypothetical protein
MTVLTPDAEQVQLKARARGLAAELVESDGHKRHRRDPANAHMFKRGGGNTDALRSALGSSIPEETS